MVGGKYQTDHTAAHNHMIESYSIKLRKSCGLAIPVDSDCFVGMEENRIK